MADYTKSIGASGTMMIRDTGTYVEFWLKAGSNTFDYDLDWGYTVNGVTDNTNEFRFESGGAYQRLGRWNVTYDQTVTFRIYDTGTSGLGSGGTLSVAINRTSAPPTPPAWAIEQIQDTRVQGDVDGFGNGGLAIDQIQVRYSLSSSASSPLYASDDNLDGYFWIEGLARGTKYYFWVRTRNSKGWSGWSAVSSATTHNYPAAPTGPVITDVKQASAQVSTTPNSNGGSAILEYEIGYGTDPNAPVSSISGQNVLITGLAAGAVTYFWARARNVYGWGPWSVRTQATLLAGVWVDYTPPGGPTTKHRAVAYVNVGGVWKTAEAFTKIAGMWKGTG